MKYLALILFCFTFQANHAQSRFVLDGETSLTLNGKKVILNIKILYSLKKFTLSDTSVIKNGRFYFSGTMPNVSEMATLEVVDGSKILLVANFALENELNHIKIYEGSIAARGSNFMYHAEFDATIANKIEYILDSIDFEEWNNHRQPIPGSPGATYLNAKDSRNLFYKQLEVLEKYPAEFISLQALYSISFSLPMANEEDKLIRSFNLLSDSIRNTPMGSELINRLQSRLNGKNRLKIGATIAPFIAKTSNGDVFNLEQLRNKPFVLAFSATWCGPCLEYQPTLLKLYQKYKTDGLEVVYTNLDDDVDKWTKMIREKKLDWINISDGKKMIESDIAKHFRVFALPLYVVVDRSGKIIYNDEVLGDSDYSKLELFIKKAISKE